MQNKASAKTGSLARIGNRRDNVQKAGDGWPLPPFDDFKISRDMTDEDERELGAQLARLQQEHRDLDAAIDALHQSPAPDLLRLQRLKKRKLLLRDRIAFIEDQITPDIIA